MLDVSNCWPVQVLTEMLAGMQESLDKANEKLQLMDAEKAAESS